MRASLWAQAATSSAVPGNITRANQMHMLCLTSIALVKSVYELEKTFIAWSIDPEVVYVVPGTPCSPGVQSLLRRLIQTSSLVGGNDGDDMPVEVPEHEQQFAESLTAYGILQGDCDSGWTFFIGGST